jgi:hypothetical protein
MKLIGLYSIDAHPDVHLLEMNFDHPPRSVDVGKITQEVSGQSQDNWQVPWDEKYLDETGEKIIGEWFEIPAAGDKTRMIFFFHHIDFSKPLLTPNGSLTITKPTLLPDRLRGLIKYESPD